MKFLLVVVVAMLVSCLPTDTSNLDAQIALYGNQSYQMGCLESAIFLGKNGAKFDGPTMVKWCEEGAAEFAKKHPVRVE